LTEGIRHRILGSEIEVDPLLRRIAEQDVVVRVYDGSAPAFAGRVQIRATGNQVRGTMLINPRWLEPCPPKVQPRPRGPMRDVIEEALRQCRITSAALKRVVREAATQGLASEAQTEEECESDDSDS
jgi:hypothetical protein